ncbi:MAG: hypothetical protein ATN33_08050 [Epulopiscium sp. Nele67-Bin001]|nr:MAG: hypothetical protein BEN18_07930 [Epulopiscium sp. Nuni2H_MBin001]OON92037.1 MAG: hypothetical protein ATN33_08050 [Epulopiscium sp. Nele67-Bin001]
MKIGVFNTVRGGAKRFSHLTTNYNGEIEFIQLEVSATDENAEKITGCEAVIFTPYKSITHAFYDGLVKAGVKYVLTCTAGFDHLDIEYMKKVGLKSANAPIYSPNSVAEYAVLSLLAILRTYKEQIHRIDSNNFALGFTLGREIRNQVIGIIGAGRIGCTTMKCLSGFGPKEILANDIIEHNEVKKYAKYVSIEEIYEKCDAIIFHCNYTNENHHMINDETIAKMKDGVYIVNVARGGLCNTKALIRGIQSGKIAGLAIDVLDEENEIRNAGQVDTCPVPELEELLKNQNVIYTPHSAFYTDQALQDMSDITAQNAYEYKTTGACSFELVK